MHETRKKRGETKKNEKNGDFVGRGIREKRLKKPSAGGGEKQERHNKKATARHLQKERNPENLRQIRKG